MHLKKTSRLLVVSGTLLIWIIKFIIRPFVHVPIAFKLFIGSAPNLIGSFLLPFGACWLFGRIFKMQTVADVRITCWFGLMLVIINEYLQLIPIFGRTFDYADIIFSFAGCLMGYWVYGKLLLRSSSVFNNAMG
ncbi:MAG: hypothetical protein KGO81_13275 [Bacteroidota bacterium]|nr:hypothetical protein [Bacteroidota bacterium]